MADGALGCVMLLALLLHAGVALAEPPQPHLSYIFPCGGRQGTNVSISVADRDLLDASAVRVTGVGVVGSVVKVVDESTLQLSATIAADAPLGQRDLRIITPGGISNRFRFFVGDLPEVNEIEPNNDRSHAQQLALPVLVNGQILEGDRDVFRFDAKAGQMIVCKADARALLPLIGDAVPGWHDAVLTLYDPNGHQLQSVDDYCFNPDPILIQKIPSDGQYFLEIHDVLYRGRGDFLYRLSIGTLPFITDFFPLGGRQRTTARVELRGINLPADTLELPLTDPAPAICPLFVTAPVGDGHAVRSNVLPFSVDSLKEFAEQEPNDSPAAANHVEPPIIINGRVGHPGDIDYFRFAAKKGEKLVMEVQARRLESPLDAILTLYDAERNKLAEEDDTVDPESPLVTHHADPRLSYQFPADGEYLLRLRDVQGKGGTEYAYRLLISPPTAGFSLRVTPDNPRVARGDGTMLTVTALRKGGFAGPIDLVVKNLPPGTIAAAAVIPANQDKALVTLTAAENAPPAVAPLQIVGTATVDGVRIERMAVATETLTQAFSYVQSLPTQEQILAVTDCGYFTLSTDQTMTSIHDLSFGEETSVTVKISRKPGVKGAIGIKALDLPGYIAVKYVTLPADQDQATLTISISPRAPEGMTHNIVLAGTMRTYKQRSDGEKIQINVTRTLPAIPIRIVPTPTTAPSTQPAER